MYVYLLKSESAPSRRYIGLTRNLKRRFTEHNAGKSTFTSKYRPWKMVVATWFEDGDKAREFELYLKKGSGHSFARRHFW